jgi:hypothetical protein
MQLPLQMRQQILRIARLDIVHTIGAADAHLRKSCIQQRPPLVLKGQPAANTAAMPNRDIDGHFAQAIIIRPRQTRSALLDSHC